MSDFLDKTHTERKKLINMANELYDLSNAFWMTGNKMMGTRLKTFADQIYLSSQAIGEAVSKEIDARLKDAQESSVNLVKGVMAGIELGKNKDGVGDVSDKGPRPQYTDCMNRPIKFDAD